MKLLLSFLAGTKLRPFINRGLDWLLGIDIVKSDISIDRGFEKRMTKVELIRLLANENPSLLYRDVERIVAVIFEEVSSALANGDRVEIRGFGSFSVKHHPARIGRNPRSGAVVEIPDRYLPAFKTGKLMRDCLNGEA